jgi:uncharacterized protein YnzC (UPF0291/DUF896 family)
VPDPRQIRDRFDPKRTQKAVSLQMQEGRRSYVHRKKYLKDCVTQVKAALEVVRIVRQEPGLPDDSHKQAVAHAESIEAACWSPNSGISPEGYRRMMAAKTQELCCAILRNALPRNDFCQLLQLLTRGTNLSVLARPRLPVPIIPNDSVEGSPIPEPAALEFPALDIERGSVTRFEDGGGLDLAFDSVCGGLGEFRPFF